MDGKERNANLTILKCASAISRMVTKEVGARRGHPANTSTPNSVMVTDQVTVEDKTAHYFTPKAQKSLKKEKVKQ